MLKKIVLGLVLTCGASVALAEGPKMGGVINAVIQPEPPGLMLAMIQNGPTQMVSGNIFEGLLRYSPKLEPLPGLAESWTVSEDAKTYTFKLKPGVTWHDDKPFTSADVLFSIGMLKETHSRARNNLTQVEKAEAPDDLTVVFTLKQPFGPFLGIFEVGSMPIMPKHIYDGTDYKTNRSGPLANKKVRQAVMYAVDRNFAKDVIWNGLGKVATGPSVSTIKFYTDDVPKY